MAIIKVDYGTIGGGTDFEVCTATIPASYSTITISLTKGKIPQAIFIERGGWFYSNFDSTGNIDSEHIYYPAASYQMSNITLSTSQIVWSNFDTSSITNSIKVYVVY